MVQFRLFPSGKKLPEPTDCFKIHQFSLTFFLFCLLFTGYVVSVDQLTPKGVPLSRAALYDPQKDFSCLDGSKLIPFSMVNDDYCDCPDGSDEPGTSACEQGTFYCQNAGHVATFISSSRVNDGLCDCCDGSDEFTSGVSCVNTCDEVGRAAREERERETRLVREGYQRRLEMSREGKEIRKTKEMERSQLEVDLQHAEVEKVEKAQAKETAEAPEKEALAIHRQAEEEKRKADDEKEKEDSAKEAEDIYNLLDSNEDGVISLDEIKARQTFDRNKDGQVSDDEALFFLNMENEMTKEEFLRTGWITVKPYFMMESGMFLPPENTDEDKPEDQGEHHEEPATETPPEVHEEEYEDDELDDQKVPDIHKEEHEEEEAKVDETKGLYDEPTRALIEAADKARQAHSDAERAVREITKKLEELNEALNLDVGEDDRFTPLINQCYEFRDREYIYTLCPFQRASQRGINGGGDVNLGKWGSWSGPENDKHVSMMYDRGQQCWNGPARSVNVKIKCGTETKVISVSEPARCEYEMEFVTPAACRKLDEVPHDHDEL